MAAPLGIAGAVKALSKKKKQEQIQSDPSISSPQSRPNGLSDPIPTTPDAPNKDSPKVFRNENTGRTSGVTMPDGRTFFGLNPDDVNAIVSGENKKRETPLGAIEQSKQAALEGQQKEVLDLGNQIGDLTEEQRNRELIKGEGAIDTATALAGGVAGASAVGGAGAAIGTAILPGVGTIIGGVGGAAIGFVGGAFAKVSIDQRQDVKQAYATGLKASSNLDWIISETNKGRLSPTQAVTMWNEELSNMYASQRSLSIMTKGAVGRELSGAMDESAKIEAESRLIPFKQQMLLQALQNPNPNWVQDNRPIEFETQ